MSKDNWRCEICNAELSYCGVEDMDGPTLDCQECRLRERIAELEEDKNQELSTENKYKIAIVHIITLHRYLESWTHSIIFQGTNLSTAQVITEFVEDTNTVLKTVEEYLKREPK
jgi:hypothetical protein